MLVIICAIYGKNPSRTVHAVEQRVQDVPYFSSFIAVMAEWSWRYRSKWKLVVHGISSHACDKLYIKKIIQNSKACRANMTGCAIFCQFYSKVMAEWPWRYRSITRVIIHDTPYYTGDDLHLIWKKSTQNCRCYWVNTACGTDRQGRREWNQFTPTISLCRGKMITLYILIICTLRNWVYAKVNFVLLISSNIYGLVRKMWYYYQYVITIIYILFCLCCLGLFNCFPSVPRVTMIVYWKGV